MHGFKRMINLKSKSLMIFFAVAGLADAAISGRVMHMINESPEFYLNYRLDRLEILSFLLIFCIGGPLVLGAVAGLCARYRFTGFISLALFVSLAALTINGALRDFPDPTGAWLILSSAAVLAFACWYGFIHMDVIRVFVAATALSLPLTLYHSLTAAGLSIAGLGDTKGTQAATPHPDVNVSKNMPNVVFIVLDEFPLTTLLDREGMIDGKRFPNLRALAGGAYWFRQTSSVSCNTPTAVPAILSGKLFGQPKPTSLTPEIRNYPRNLFTLLSSSHVIKAWETLTRLCPANVCDARNERSSRFMLGRFSQHLGVAWLHATLPLAMSPLLPNLDDYWMEAAASQDVLAKNAHGKLFPVRVQQFRQLIDSIVESDVPWLRFGHFLMPHAPFENLPDGTFYYKGATQYAMDGKKWNAQAAHVDESYFRHILQAMFTDRLLGELVSRLRNVGEYDSTTLVIVADHGVSFVPGDARRITNKQNYSNLIGVPFIMKLAGQHSGKLIDTPVQTIDVLPTLLASLDKRFHNMAFDGRDVLAQGAPIKERLHYCSGSSYQSFQPELLPAFLKQVAVKNSKFGDRSDGALEMNFASFPDWIGRTVDEMGHVERSGRTARLMGLLPNQGAVKGATNAPLYLNGTIDGPEPLGSDDLLFVATLNGQIASVMPAVHHKQQHRIISAMLQPAFLRDGENIVELYAIDRNASGPYAFFKLDMSGVLAGAVTDRVVFER